MAQTEEQRREAARVRMQEKRRREREAREAAKAAAANAANAEAGTEMRDAVDAALGAMKWLTPSDEGAKAQARFLARKIDVLEHEGDTIRLLSAHQALTRVLHELGGTPTVRMQHELRSLKLRKDDDGGEGEGAAGRPAGNVSRFERPAKRRA